MNDVGGAATVYYRVSRVRFPPQGSVSTESAATTTTGSWELIEIDITVTTQETTQQRHNLGTRHAFLREKLRWPSSAT